MRATWRMPLVGGKYLSNYFCVRKLFARYAQRRHRERLQQRHAPRAAFRQPRADVRAM